MNTLKVALTCEFSLNSVSGTDSDILQNHIGKNIFLHLPSTTVQSVRVKVNYFEMVVSSLIYIFSQKYFNARILN